MSSAGNTRGLIEAPARPSGPCRRTGLPRGIPAASLKPTLQAPEEEGRRESSAGNTRGLIEAYNARIINAVLLYVFRGEYPRPH